MTYFGTVTKGVDITTWTRNTKTVRTICEYFTTCILGHAVWHIFISWYSVNEFFFSAKVYNSFNVSILTRVSSWLSKEFSSFNSAINSLFNLFSIGVGPSVGTNSVKYPTLFDSPLSLLLFQSDKIYYILLILLMMKQITSFFSYTKRRKSSGINTLFGFNILFEYIKTMVVLSQTQERKQTQCIDHYFISIIFMTSLYTSQWWMNIRSLQLINFRTFCLHWAAGLCLLFTYHRSLSLGPNRVWNLIF